MKKDVILTERQKKKFAKQRTKAEIIFLKDKKKGLDRMIKLCKRGNPNAAYFLYRCMMHGVTITQKREEIDAYLCHASFFLQRAADYGDGEARYDLAKRYEKGKYVEMDESQAFHYMLLAAKSGYRDAMSRVAIYYERGIGTKNSVEKSLYWQKEGIERGCLYCKLDMAKRYQYGKGVPKDCNFAAEFYEKIRKEILQLMNTDTEGKEEYSEEELQRLLSYSVEQKKTLEIIRVFTDYETIKTEYLKEMRRERIRQYADEGEWLGQFYMGYISEEENNYTEALRWYALAIDKGSSGAMANSGWIYYYGKGVEQDYKKAYDFFMCSAKSTSNKMAMFYLGEMYEKGHYVKADLETALYWYRESALQGDKAAKKRLEAIEAKKSS